MLVQMSVPIKKWVFLKNTVTFTRLLLGTASCIVDSTPCTTEESSTDVKSCKIQMNFSHIHVNKTMKYLTCQYLYFVYFPSFLLGLICNNSMLVFRNVLLTVYIKFAIFTLEVSNYTKVKITWFCKQIPDII